MLLDQSFSLEKELCFQSNIKLFDYMNLILTLKILNYQTISNNLVKNSK